MNDIVAIKVLLKQAEGYLLEELKISNDLANKLELELLLDDAQKA